MIKLENWGFNIYHTNIYEKLLLISSNSIDIWLKRVTRILT